MEQEQNKEQNQESLEQMFEALETIKEMQDKRYPKFRCKIDKQYLDLGAREASYLVGFIGAINKLGFSESVLATIANNKIKLEYNKELLRMKIESEEHIASMMSKLPIHIVGNEE